jgi:hypothetical protein
MEQNKTGKYFKYAIGEIVLVVLGILIALSINNWNESRKTDQKKQELVLNLIEDFEQNRIELKKRMENNINIEDKIHTFFENAYKPTVSISLDSLRTLCDAFFRPNTFLLSMITYDEAKANGNLSLLKNKDLNQQFVNFQISYQKYLKLDDVFLAGFFNGPVWEIKKSIGSLSLLTGRQREGYTKFDIDIDAYKKIINKPMVIATLENQATLHHNQKQDIIRLDSYTKKIIEILNKLKQ